MTYPTEIEVLRTVTERLEQGEIPYMLSGSMALSFYGRPRMTRDIDIVVELHGDDVDCMVRLFDNDFYIDADMVRQAVACRGMFNIIHYDSVLKVDFIVRKDTPYRATEFARRKRVKIGVFDVWIVTPEDLVLSKLEWAKASRSEIQIRDIKNLLDSLHGQIDMDYLRYWVKELAVDAFLEEILRERYSP